MISNITSSFHQLFPGFCFELSDIQQATINSIVQGKNTLCLLRTGGGKSIIYWLSGLLTSATTLVISPLTALIIEQSRKLESLGYSTLVIGSGTKIEKQTDVLLKFANGEIVPRFIFVSPEKLATDGFLSSCLLRRKSDIKLVVLDEVHCVSQWGIGFRPFYKQIPKLLDSVWGINDWPMILALTATLNPREINDICNDFKIRDEDIQRDKGLLRHDVRLSIKKFTTENEKESYLWELLKRHKDEKTLVYVYRKFGNRGVEDFAQEAKEDYSIKAEAFHGEYSSEIRYDIIEQFRSGQINVVFATNAFGLGIDIPDIRVIIHFMIPESIEQYYQEIGRASRDKTGANAYLLYSDKNIDVKRRFFIEKSFPKDDELAETYQKITSGETGVKTLQYFEDENIQNCLSYFLDEGLITIVAKGFSSLRPVSTSDSVGIAKYIQASKTKSLITTAKKLNIPVSDIVEDIYNGIIENKVKLLKTLDRVLIISVNQDAVPESSMISILKSIKEKKEYKHELLSHFVQILSTDPTSIELHQEIGSFFGVENNELNKIHTTEDGNSVRSKSEVIISNLLYEHGVSYIYEKSLHYGIQGKSILPDFTIIMPNGDEMYWEHLGCLGMDEYDQNWKQKQIVYDTYFPGKLIKTYESGALSNSAIEKIRNIQATKSM